MADVASFVTYASERALTGADASEADLSSALLRAQDHLAFNYLNRVVRPVPENVQDAAIYQLMVQEVATPGFYTKTYTQDGRKTLTEVDGIVWKPIANGNQWQNPLEDRTVPVNSLVEGMLRPYTYLPRTSLNSLG